MSMKKELIKILEEYSDLLEFKGENPFKINAFRNGANILRRMEGELEDKVEDGSIFSMKGIGKGLQGLIKEFYNNGIIADYEQLKSEIPAGITDIMNVRGLGAKKIKFIYENLGVDSLDKLQKAAENGEIAGLKGFSGKSQQNILEEIDKIKKRSGYMLLHKALFLADEILEKVSNYESVVKVEKSGELRRIMEVIGKLEFVALIKEKAKFIDGLKNSGNCDSVNVESNSKIIISWNSYQNIVFHLAYSEEEYTKVLFETTGSQEFLQQTGYKSNGKSASNEKELFKVNKLNFVTPEMREKEYFQCDEKLRVESNLDFNGMKGLLHFHTTYSDGNNTLTEMIKAAKDNGFEYAAVCDHSKTAFYANGLKEDRILQEKEETKKVGEELKFTIYQGIESDILKNGDLDYDSDFMKNFDFVVASVHSVFNLSENDMTQRIVNAVENEFTDVLGHPTGRLLLTRDAYKLNQQKVIDACYENNVAIEINANPHRLDLDWRWVWYAREKSCLLSINADAHSTEEILLTEYGIKVARKAGLQKKEVINYFSKEDFVKFLNRKIKRIR